MDFNTRKWCPGMWRESDVFFEINLFQEWTDVTANRMVVCANHAHEDAWLWLQVQTSRSNSQSFLNNKNSLWFGNVSSYSIDRLRAVCDFPFFLSCCRRLAFNILTNTSASFRNIFMQGDSEHSSAQFFSKMP